MFYQTKHANSNIIKYHQRLQQFKEKDKKVQQKPEKQDEYMLQQNVEYGLAQDYEEYKNKNKYILSTFLNDEKDKKYRFYFDFVIFEESQYDKFRLTQKLTIESLTLKQKQTKWLPLVTINGHFIGNYINLSQKFKKTQYNTCFILILEGKIGDTINIIGWSYFFPLKNYEIQKTGFWKIPFYYPPVQNTVNVKAIQTQILNFWGYIRIGKCKEDHYSMYQETLQHNMAEEHIQFYKEWEKRHNQRKVRLNEMMHGYKKDLEIVQDGLKEENDLANRILEEERLLTEQMIKEMIEKMKVKELEIFEPLQDQIKELKKKLGFLKDDMANHVNMLHKRGLKITLHNLENILQINPIKAHVIVWRNDQIDFDVNCNVTKYKTQNIEDFMNSKKIRQKIKDQENFDIEIEEEFFVFKYYKPDLKDKDITITIEISLYEIQGSSTFENKEQKKYLDSYLVENDEILIGKTYLILKYENDSINVGRYKHSLYEDLLSQNPPYQKSQIHKTEQKISFTIEEFYFDDENQKQMFFRNKRPRKKQEDKVTGEKRPFIENLEVPIRKIFENGSGIDIYIDNCRYMSNSVTLSKVVLRIVDSSLKDIIKPSSKLCDIHSNIFNPVFNMKKELRLPFYDPTSMLLITILTIDERETDINKQCKIMGYSFFPLFLSKSNLQQPEDRFEENYFLNEGLYQIPIYCEDYYQEKPFLYKNQQNLDRISCSSILIRVLFAPKEKDTAKVLSSKDYPKEQWEKLGILIPAPDYQNGKYITSHFKVTNQELQLFDYYKSRQSVYALDKAVSIGLQKKTFQFILDKGLDNDQLKLEVINLMNGILDFEKAQELLEQKYNNIYDPKIGFKFCIDGFHNLNKEVFPNMNMQTQEQDPLTIHINTLFDWNSPVTSPKYLEGYTLFKNIPLNRNSCMIVDIRQVYFKNKKVLIKEYGWTIVPLFTTDGFVDSGVFQIPIFQGSIRKKFLKVLNASRDSWETVKSLMSQVEEGNKQKMVEPIKYSSVIVRLVDASRSGHLKKSFDYRRMNYRYIPEDQNFQYAYNDIVQQELKKKPKLEKTIPKNMSSFQINKMVTDAIINLLDLYQKKAFRRNNQKHQTKNYKLTKVFVALQRSKHTIHQISSKCLFQKN